MPQPHRRPSVEQHACHSGHRRKLSCSLGLDSGSWLIAFLFVIGALLIQVATDSGGESASTTVWSDRVISPNLSGGGKP